MRARSIGSHVLLGLGILAVAVALIFSYLNQNIFDSASFADHAQAALKDQQVRDYAARQLTDQLITEIAPDAVAVGPLIETISGAVIQSDAFGRAFRSAVLQLHRAVATGDTKGAVLTVANVGVLVAGALERVAPQFARQIPDGFDSALVQLANLDAVSGVVRAAHVSRQVTWISAGLAALLLTLAFLVSPRRRRLLRTGGFGLIVAGLLVIGAWFASRGIVIRSATGGDGGALGAAREVWDSFMYGLVVDAAILAALGAVLAACADGLLTGIDLERRLTEVVKRALHPPERSGRRVLWAFALLFAGTLIALNPGLVARVLIVVLGVLIGARGFQALALMIAPPDTPTAKAEEPHQVAGSRRRWLLVAGSIVGIALLGLVISTHRGGGLETLGIVQNTTACNGSDSLCPKRLNQVALATTHNSMSEQTAPGFLFPSQEASIGRQLSDGIRGLQIDVYYGFPGSRVYTDADRSSPKARAVMKEEFGAEFVNAADRVRRSLSRPAGVAPQLYLCHGFCELGATKFTLAMAQIKQFLEANPREVVAIVFEDHVPWQSLAEGLEDAGLARFGYRGPWSGELPKLGDVIASNHRLLLLTENAEPDVPWMHNAYKLFQETPFNYRSVAELAAPSSCDPMRGEPGNPMFLINHWVDTPPNPRPSIARRVNSFDFLWQRVERCSAERKLFPNMIAVDFYREGDLFKVVDKLNGVR